jgi:hypothetical protein
MLLNMGNIRTVFRFGWVYLRRYWTRLAAGILFGIVFWVDERRFHLGHESDHQPDDAGGGS